MRNSQCGELFCWGWRLERSASGEVAEGYSTLPDKVHALAGLEVRHVHEDEDAGPAPPPGPWAHRLGPTA